MVVTLQRINRDGSSNGSSITISFTNISRSVKDKKLIQPLPDNHILVPLGKEGPTLSVKFVVVGTTEYEKVRDWDGGVIINVVSSTDPEMVATSGRTPSDTGSNGGNCEVWNIDDVKSERAGGQVNRWLMTCTLTRYWNWKQRVESDD